MEIALELKDLKYKYPNSDSWVLDGVNLKIKENSLVVLVGSTGCGKSTLIRTIRGLQKEQGGELAGSILLNRKEIINVPAFSLGSEIAIVFQNPAYQLHQPRVIDEIMSSPMYQNLPWRECIKRAENSIKLLSLQSLLDKNPTNLSVGEQQKVALAASLSMKANLLLMDEPYSYLDINTRDEFSKIITKLKNIGMTIILATHDLDAISDIVDEVILLEKGKIKIRGLSEKVLYSEDLLEAIGCPFIIDLGRKLYKKKLVKNKPIIWDDLSSQLGDSKEIINKNHPNFGKTKTGSPIVEISHISYNYPNGNKGIEDISLNIQKGEIFGIVGTNGSGKSTLAKLILGLLKPSNGTIKILGDDISTISRIAKTVGYITQNPSTMLFESTVEKECSFGPEAIGKENVSGIVYTVLKKMGLMNYLERDPHSLSGGEQRLLSIADILVNDPEIIIMDEPEFGLDSLRFGIILNIIKDLNSSGKTIIMITHDLLTATFICDRILLMKKSNSISVTGTKQLIFNQNLLEQGGLKSHPMFSVLEYFNDQLPDLTVNKQILIDTIVSYWPRRAKL
jgi:energy-coupling factor transport system ATP-binding protein